MGDHITTRPGLVTVLGLTAALTAAAAPFRPQPYTVRVVYIVPADQQAWPEAQRRAAEWLEDMQWFFAGEMQRLAYEPKTFEIARDTHGSVVFHGIRTPMHRADFDKDPVDNCKLLAKQHGLRCAGDVVVYFYESYTISGGAVSGAGAMGGRSGPGGEVFLSSLHLKMARREWFANGQTYGGQVFDWISPEPMKPDTLSWNGRGQTLGDVSGAAYGVMGHELGHAFGLSHDMVGDSNRRGNLMGNGCRGMRGYFMPRLTSDRCVLGAPSAAVLDGNGYFAVRRMRPRSAAFADGSADQQ